MKHAQRSRSMRICAIWAVSTLCLIALLWKVTSIHLNDEKSALLGSARQKAAALAKTHARQLSHSLEQADQAALSLQYDWEELHQPQLLERRLRRSVRPSLGLRAAGVADSTGKLLASSGPVLEDVAQTGFFLRHRESRGEGLLVSRVPDGALSSASLLLSRRLDAGNGGFDGLVMFVADPSFLLDFGAEVGLGGHDFLSLVDSAGQVLLSSAYSRPGVVQSPLMRAHAFEDSAGIAVLPASEFDDATRRIVAWQRLAQGGLTVVAGLSESDVLAVYQQAAQRHYGWALAASLLLLAVGGAGLRLSLRRARRERRRAELSKTYSLAVDRAEEGFYTVRALYARDGSLSDFVIEDCNERGAELVGWAKRDLVGRRFLQLYSGSHAQQLLSVFGVAMETGYYEDEMLASPHGPLGARWLSRRLVRSGSEIAMTVRDITERRAQEQALSQLANTDPLTGLPNRHWLMEFMPQAISGCIASNSSMALLFVDLDDFRHINDSLGHGMGDLLLKQASARLKSLVRASDHVVRLGGDEFTVVLQNVQGSDDVSRVTRLVIKALQEPFEVPGQGEHVVQASVGVSMYPRDGADRDTLLKHADLALYAAKAEGKGRFSFYEPGLSDSLMRRLGKEQALRRAIEQDQFIMFFQPRVNTQNGALCGMEALVRWMHPERGMLAPEEFIQIAEDTGLIREIGSTVIEKTIAQIASWRELGLPVPPVSINVSALQFDEGHLRPLLVGCMKRYRVDAGLIEIEITESSMLGGGDLVSGQLAAIRQLGIKLLIDDFGTGYSSLSQLQRLEMDVLKIDRAFTSQLRNESGANVLFNAIVVMAHALGMRVVAEGVESVGQLRALQAMGCDEVQGFYVSRPVPAAEMPALMRQDCLFPPVRPELKLVAGE
ncbi:bifunctional diguanylate cyclase/phosphodiesterase [Noviherbaspirillum soli]|uniref:bifunctional diguanylate cyclase/phosphodiesterase n=1 Tax=Noviherbaspirillum soli TaxID=1064518 RepID=UPI00188D0C41|nr:EAL domain-containing protein [Noviherbaspirillum soli]